MCSSFPSLSSISNEISFLFKSELQHYNLPLSLSTFQPFSVENAPTLTFTNSQPTTSQQAELFNHHKKIHLCSLLSEKNRTHQLLRFTYSVLHDFKKGERNHLYLCIYINKRNCHNLKLKDIRLT